MALQDSVNQLVGSVSHAAVAGKAISNQQKAVKNQEKQQTIAEAGMAEKLAEEKGNLADLEDIQKQQLESLELAKQGINPDTKEVNAFASAEDINKDVEMRQKALQVLKGKIAAKQQVISAYNNVLGGKR